MDGVAEVLVNGATYRIGRLSPRKSFHVARRLAPFLGAIMPHLRALFAPDADGKPPTTETFAVRGAMLVPGIADVLAGMTNEDCDFIFDACLAVVQVRQEKNWAPIVAPSGQMMFENIDMKTMLEIVTEVIKANLGDFFPSSQPPAPVATTTMPQ